VLHVYGIQIPIVHSPSLCSMHLTTSQSYTGKTQPRDSKSAFTSPHFCYRLPTLHKRAKPRISSRTAQLIVLQLHPLLVAAALTCLSSTQTRTKFTCLTHESIPWIWREYVVGNQRNRYLLFSSTTSLLVCEPGMNTQSRLRSILRTLGLLRKTRLIVEKPFGLFCV
jgi:hypothetical protein